MQASLNIDGSMNCEIWATVDMEITPEMEQIMKTEWNLELEMLQGQRDELPSGMVKYKLEIRDPYKAELLREFTLKMISFSHKHPMN